MTTVTPRMPLQELCNRLGPKATEDDASVIREALCESEYLNAQLSEIRDEFWKNRLIPLAGKEIKDAAEGHVSSLADDGEKAQPSDAYEIWNVGDLPVPRHGSLDPKKNLADAELIRAALAERIRQALGE